MKIYLSFFLSAFIFINVNSQEKKLGVFGENTLQDNQISKYDNDPEAAALVLYEKGKVKVILNKHRYLVLNKEVHKKIKIFDAKKFQEDATIEILYYENKDNKEIVKDLKAITHNGDSKSYVNKSNFFSKTYNENYSAVSFTFPNIKDGSIIEYSYTVESPFFHRYQWDFQDKYPKLYSEFNSEIPGNYEYRASLGGKLKIDYQDSFIKDNCFSVDGYGDAADCVYSEFIMKDIPAFKEEEYMLSKHNYISKIKYDLKETMSFTGEKTFYTKTWKDVDKELRFHDHVGRQLGFSSFFKNRIPESILNITDKLERAKAIYYFIQKNYTWDGDHRFYSDTDVKDAFENGGGNIAEINIILINALQAADIDAHLVLSATRDIGLPTLIYPTLTEFNYVLAFLKIEDKEYYLDASNRYTPFGLIPYRALNKIGRVMDFKNESYWHPITPFKRNISYINATLKLDENGILNGAIEEKQSGYFAVSARESSFNSSLENYLKEKESKQLLLEISNYTNENLNNNEEVLIEKYDISVENELVADKIFINPFFLSNQFNENPFNLDERTYEVEMGYPRDQFLLLSFEVDESFEIDYLPENKIYSLPYNLGKVSVMYLTQENNINIRFHLKIEEETFEPELYPSLKEFFSRMVELKTKNSIVLKKV